MLTTSEVNKLFDLLKELHGKDKSRDKRTIAIWLKVLEPWTFPTQGAIWHLCAQGVSGGGY